MTNKLHNKNFGILGVGISNRAVLEFFITHNYKFIIWDDNAELLKALSTEINTRYNVDINSFITKPDDSKWQNIDYLIMSPGIPLSHPKPHQIIDFIKKTNVKIICDIELFYMLYPDNQYIGITGTNGKSTITALTYHIISTFTKDVVIAGNIGEPIFFLTAPKNKIIVLEMSSYQIDLLDTIRFSISALSNITPDHIDRHGSLENYTQIKYRLLSKFNSGISIINIDTPITESLYQKLKQDRSKVIPTSTKILLKNGISLISNVIQDNVTKNTITVPKSDSLIGNHNAQNIVISYSIASCVLKLPEAALKSITLFKGLKHRMQFIDKYQNITFINDSKGTNAVSTLQALESYNNIYWILGGVAKEEGITPLIPVLSKVKHAFAIGQSKYDFAKILKKQNVVFSIHNDLKEAFLEATQHALKESDNIVIMLSPACASFDQWKNFVERGDAFIKLVTDFINSQTR